MQIDPYLTLWIVDFLSNRTQTVCIKSPLSSSSSTASSLPAACFSSPKTINTGAPQGTVISPFVFTLYTNDCRSSSGGAHVVKFSDDAAIVDVSDSVASFETNVCEFLTWCDDNYLELNVGKTKEMLVDFRRNRTDVAALTLRGETVERVEEYKYLGTMIDNKLTFTANADMIFRKCRQRMYMLYQLRSLLVSQKVLEQCYRAFIESLLTFSFVCWYQTLNVRSKKLLNGITNTCSKIVGRKQAPLSELYQRRVLGKAIRIKDDPSHPMSHMFELLPSGTRLRNIKCRTVRYQSTFLPTAVSLVNTTIGRG
jgi:hypothetical protein